MNDRRRLGALLAISLAFPTGLAWAAEEVYTDTFEWALTELTGVAGANPAIVQVPRFDDQGGARVLTQVKVELRGDLTTGGDPNDNPPAEDPPTNTGYTTPGALTNTAAQAQNFRYTQRADLFQADALAGSPAVLTSVPLVAPGTVLLTRLFTAVPAGGTVTWGPTTLNSSWTAQTLNTPAALAEFVGGGTFGYSAQTLIGEAFAGGGGNVITAINTAARFEIKVTYTYQTLLGAIGDYLWDDLNRDGIQNEPPSAGINGQNVFLLDCQGNLIDTTITANDSNGDPGFYLFDDLAPGCYRVEFTKPAGLVFTSPNQGLFDADSDADPGTGRTGPINLAPGEVNLSVDAGVHLATEPKLGDRVWEDKNGNGQQDPDEPGIPGATVELYNCANQLIASTTTNANGDYLFTVPDVMVNGCYQVKFLPPTNYCAGAAFTDRQATGVNPAFDSDAPVSDQVTLTAPNNLEDLTVDAGVICPAAIGNYLWNDLNRDGNQDEPASEGINGQQVSLQYCDGTAVTNILGSPVGPQVTANADARNPDNLGQPGYYLFDNLTPGCYVVTFTKPADFVFTEPNQGGDPTLDSDADLGTGRTGPIDLVSGETDRTWDAGVYEPTAPEIGDFLWEDKDGDGRQDPGEPGINGATVNLYDCQGNLVATTITGPDARGQDGYYLFTAPDVQVGGCYTVEFEPPVAYCEGARFTERQAAGVASGLNSDGPVSDQILVTAPDNLVDRSIDAGVICPAALGDYVWEDMNRDGIQNEGPESGVNGVEVQLLDPGPDGVCATGDEEVRDTTVTANDTGGNPGYYLFSPLDPGAYCVQVVKPADWSCTIPNVGPDQPSALDSDVEDTPPAIAVCQTKDPAEDPIDLESGEFDSSWDAGLYRPASLGDFVWQDRNRNGQQDTGEPGIGGVTVTLLRCDGSPTGRTTVTASDGSYLFEGLDPGCYRVRFATPAGFLPTLANTGPDATDSDPVDGVTGDYTLASGESNLTVDAGFYRPARLGDRVWEDTNRNGQQDAGEPGIGGVTVTLLRCDGSSTGRTTVTASNGSYLFEGLDPGCYRVQFATPEGYFPTLANTGPDATDSDPVDGVTGNYTLVSGQTNRTVDAGFYRPARLGDFAWNDLNANGIQDAGEPGVPGVTIILTGSDGSSRTATTDGNGLYGFGDLLPGVEYTAVCVAPAGYTYTPVFNQDRANGTNSNANPANGGMGSYVLASGENLPTVDCGLIGGLPGIDIEKATNGEDADSPTGPVVAVGSTVTWTYVVRNTGNVVLTNVAVTDSDIGAITCPKSELAVGEAMTCTATGLAVLGQYANTATVTGTPPVGPPVTDEDPSHYLGVGASLGDFVWEDLNGNGIQDSGEPGVGGVTITLAGSDGSTRTATTSGNGLYGFGDLVPGVSYTAVCVAPAGYTYTPVFNQDRDNGINSNADPATGSMGAYVLAAGEDLPTVDCGLYRPASLGDFVWEDRNANGIQDAGEPGVGGVTITLSGSDGSSRTASTDGNGLYGFGDLLPGVEYTAVCVAPAGYTYTPVFNQDRANGTNSNANPANGGMGSYVLASGENLPTVDCGLIVPSCDVAVTKTCAIVEPTPTTGTGTCQKPIDTLVMEYAAAQSGGKQIASVQWFKGTVGSTLLGTLGPVADGETISMSGFGGSPNDVQARITFTDGTSVVSQFHISCSDSEMNGPEDCGKLSGDGKANSLPAGNIWLFRGTNGSNGGITCPVNTTPTFPTETTNCDFVATPDVANCSALKPVTELTMVWDGPSGVNFQTALGQSITGVQQGDVVRFNTTGSGNDFLVNITGAIIGQSSLHISCSDSEMNGPEDCGKRQGNNKANSPSLINDFLFAGMAGSNGAFGCPGYPAATAGREVNYGIAVRNLNASPLTVQILDPKLGISQTQTIPANGVYQEVVGPRFIVPDGSNVFVNTVSVSGTTENGATCAASDSVSVTRQQPLVPVACSSIKPVTAVSLVWNGTQTVDIVMESGETFRGVQPGNRITFLEAKTGNDVYMEIYDSATGAFIGESVFHVSCSDADMNGTEDCGKPQGNNKANDPSLINQWLFDGMAGALGSFACGLPNTGTVDPEDSGGGIGPQVTGATVADLGDPKKFKWSLKNETSQDVFLTQLYVAWPDGTNGQGQLSKVKLGGDEIAKDVKDSSSPTMLPEDKAFERDANRRKLKRGETQVLEIEFSKGTVFRSQDDFLVVATFSNGDVVTFNPTPVSVTGAATLDLGDNRRVRWDLTNNTPGTAQITEIRVAWPAAHRRLNRVRLAGKDVATSVNDTSSPTVLPQDKAFTTNLGDRSIDPGVTKRLEVEFSTAVSGRTQGQFSIQVTFSNGDVVTFN